MEVLEGMWIKVDEYTEVDEACLIVAISFGGRARHTRIEVSSTRPTSSGCVMERSCGGRSSRTGTKHLKPPDNDKSQALGAAGLDP